MYVWALWEDLFKQNTEEYCMLNTGKIYLHKILRNILYVEHCEKIYLHKIHFSSVFCVNKSSHSVQHTIFCVNKSSHSVEHKRFIYTKIVRNTVCWKLWEDLFTQNTEEYFMLNSMRRFIYTKYWGILYVEHCGKKYSSVFCVNISSHSDQHSLFLSILCK
jgi:hypothetical protein